MGEEGCRISGGSQCDRALFTLLCTSRAFLNNGRSPLNYTLHCQLYPDRLMPVYNASRLRTCDFNILSYLAV